jgi:amino acid adenylation domain-containing protein
MTPPPLLDATVRTDATGDAAVVEATGRRDFRASSLHLLYWQSQLAELPLPLPLPTRPAVGAPALGGSAGGTTRGIHRGDPAEVPNVAPDAAETLLLAVWVSLLHRYSRQSVCWIKTNWRADLLVPDLLVPDQVTMRQNFAWLPLRVRLDELMTIAQLVDQITQTITRDRQHPVPFGDLLNLVPQEPGGPVHPLNQLGFGVGSMENGAGLLQPDVALVVTANQHWELHYNPQCFDPATIARMAGHYRVMLAAAIAQPEQPIGQLAWLTEAEQVQLLETWNATQVDYPALPVAQQFEAQVARTPDAIAVIYGDRQVTYAELNQRSNQLAQVLRQRGVAANVRVGLCVERSLDVMVGLLGILKAGGAYVPIDPAYPDDRIALMLADAAASIVVTQTAIAAHLHTGQAAVICLDQDWPTIAESSPENLAPLSRMADLAYILYTSGSTGRPKGVMISQRAFANFLGSMAQQPGLTATDTVLALTSLSFDIAGLEIFLPLVVGARLVMADRWYATDGKALAALVEQHDITLMQATPTGWRLLLESGWLGRHPLKILTGGEALLRSLADELIQRCDELWDLYGPTETTVYSTGSRIVADGQTITIGYPIANTQAYILDHQLQPVPIGVIGELYLGGDGLADGYLNRADRSSERFLANPWRPGSRFYRTGDLARYWADGQIEYLGRMDNQVKIRGFRIELGEIESALEAQASVQQAVVVPREDSPGEPRLVAYVVGRNRSKLGVAALRSALRQSLPEYMVPAGFVVLPQFPLTPSGKVDRKALPAPSYTLDERDRLAARDGLELELIELWESLLKVQNLGIRDNFFDVGGQSLLAARLADQLSSRFGQMISPAHVFQSPTVEGMAQRLRGEVDEAVLPAMMVLQAGHPDRPPLFAIHVLGERGSYFRPMTTHLDAGQPVYGLAAQMLGADAPPNRVPELATYYVAQIKAIQPQGPYHVIGMSFGGTVTYEVARQLRQQGDRVAFVGLLDTAGPWVQAMQLRHSRLKIHWRNTIGEGWPYIQTKLTGWWQRQQLSWQLRWQRWQGQPLSYELHYQQLLRENAQALSVYDYPVYDDELVLFRATEAVFYDDEYLAAGLGWRTIAPNLVMYDVPGNHISITDEPNVKVLANYLSQHLPHA